MHNLNTMLERWRSENVILLLAEQEETVRQVFSALGMNATQDVIDLYTTLGGMAAMDNEYWRLWSLAEIQEENPQPSSKGILFADYCVSCWCYRLKPISASSCAVYIDHFINGEEPKLIASSLTEFFDLYANDPSELLYCN
ncbi:SMI1/KNR4 family protein [Deefgea rivuli]|uniref:SMI1/KNR4 family protein n=1 Tax=Deefgea rivuli TaxID=400948 RepID=UPI0004813A33|nr:SMI1/KNR4 family protein [Deefgea rivuli]